MSEDTRGQYDPYDDAPEWTKEDEDRYQARRREEQRRRRRRRRQGWSFALLVLLVLGAGVAGAGIAQGWWEWPFGQEPQVQEPTPGCSATAPAVALPADVQVTVLNATDTRGLASGVAAELQARGYVVTRVGNEESGVDVSESAQVRYGAALTADARSVALQVPGAVLVDDGRTGDVVDVVLGTGYRAMTPAEEAAGAVAAGASTGCPSSAPATTAPPTTTG